MIFFIIINQKLIPLSNSYLARTANEDKRWRIGVCCSVLLN